MSIAGLNYKFVKCGNCGRISTPLLGDANSRNAALDTGNLVDCPHCNQLARACPVDNVSFTRRTLSGSNIIRGVWCIACNQFSDGYPSTCNSCKSSNVREAYRVPGNESFNVSPGLRLAGSIAAGVACAAFAPVVLPIVAIKNLFSKKKS